MSFENPLWGASIGERDNSAMRNLAFLGLARSLTARSNGRVVLARSLGENTA